MQKKLKRSAYSYASTYYTYYKIWAKTLQYVNCPLRLLDPAYPKQYAQRWPIATLIHLYKVLVSFIQVQYAQN